MPLLIVIGLLYNAGIWADKMIFWFSPKGEQIDAFLYAFADYDGAAFISYLTIIPSYTYFLVKVETDFYGHFRKFYAILLNKGSLTQINNHKTNITKSVKESFIGLIKLQGAVTLVCLLFSGEIAELFKLPLLSTLILDKALLAVFLQMMLLTVLIFLMYFDIKLQLLIVALVFFLSNTLFTYITFKLGYVFYGYGYLFSCLLALITGFICLNKHLNELEYRTFTGQPLIN